MLGKKKMVRQVIIYFILFFYILYKTPSAGEDNRCEGEEGGILLRRARVNCPCFTVCICYIFYSPLFKLILKSKHL